MNYEYCVFIKQQAQASMVVLKQCLVIAASAEPVYSHQHAMNRP
ncbi:MAG TPA: hypothetical protein VIM93_04730 [Kangiella sp.]